MSPAKLRGGRRGARTATPVALSPLPDAHAAVPHDAAPESAATAISVVPFNARRLDETAEQWAAADWAALARPDRDELEAHPDRARLILVAAAAALQAGDRRLAFDRARQAAEWACDRAFAARLLLASARNALGRASFAARRNDEASEHFRLSFFDLHAGSRARRLAHARVEATKTELSSRLEVVQRQRRVGLKVEGVAASPDSWIADLITQCLNAADVHDAVDTAMARMLPGAAKDRVGFLMGLASRFEAQGDKITATHFLNTACDAAAEVPRELRRALAYRLVALGQAATALDLLVDDSLSATDTNMAPELRYAVRQAYAGLRHADQARHEHGHELLLAHLRLHLPAIRARAGSKPLSMVEIGTTRENVPGQGSTRKLAEFCRDNVIAFVTVDMDPHNARTAEETFRKLGVAFEAEAMKGEDYLVQRQTPIDFMYLDAYDFDHGKHSELRQSRYVKFLGSPIDEAACHQMHLDCARSLPRLVTPYGIVCFDDTWLRNGQWTAKGTLAMPFLLDNGFEVVDARNRAALLRRTQVLAP